MTLLEDIEVEREELAEQVSDIVVDLIPQAKYAIETQGHCSPIVISIAGTRVRTHFLSWRNEWEKNKLMSEVNEDLRELNTTASIFAYTGRFTDSNAVVFSIRTPEWSDDLIVPYQEINGEYIWGEPEYANQILDSSVEVPCLN